MLRLSGSAPTVEHTARIVPITLDAIIHMIREADFIQPEGDGVLHHILHGIFRIIAVAGVNVIISKHGSTSC